MTVFNPKWVADAHPNYIKLDGVPDALVRTKPSPSGRYLWQFGKAYDYADTVEAAKEMVEGLTIGHGHTWPAL